MKSNKGFFLIATVMFVATMITTLGLLATNQYYNLNNETQRYRRLIAIQTLSQNLATLVQTAYDNFRTQGACQAGNQVQLPTTPAGQPFCFRQDDTNLQYSCVSHPFQNANGDRQLCITPAPPASPNQDIQTASFHAYELNNESKYESWMTAAKEIIPNLMGLAIGKHVSSVAVAANGRDASLPTLSGGPANDITFPVPCNNATANSELCVRCSPPGAMPATQPCFRARVCLFSDPATGRICPLTDDSTWMFQRFAILAF